jgi:F-type H+-transporting ATPase subunit a
LSLAIRLFANIFAGHVLVTVLSTASFAAISTPALSGVGLFVLLPIIVAIQTLEVFICFLQAYVFSVLSVIYLNEAITYADH